MNYIANQINEMLTMEQIIERYNIAHINRNKTISCPFHNEKTASCRLYDKSFYCFGCGKGGDIIRFIQLYFNLNFMQAIMRMNYDFALNLPIGKKLTTKEKKELDLQNKKIKVRRELEEKIKQAKEERYYDTLSSYIALERQKQDYAPKSIEEIEEVGFNDKYVSALQQFDYVSFLLDLQELERSKIR